MTVQGETTFHVEFKTNGTHHYFGSIAAIFELFTAEDVGVTAHRLYDFNVEPGKPYKNKICTIRKGKMRRKHGNRKRPV